MLSTRILGLACAVTVFVCLLAAPVSGMDASRLAQTAQDRAPVFSSSADLVVVHVTVRRGAYVTDLPRDAFRIAEDSAALAGHRDTFFRPIRRLRTEIRLVTTRGTFRYRATRQMVVGPDELWVLDPSPTVGLTLITCYPFDFIGAAPRRFVVHAERIAETSEARALSGPREDGVR